MLNGILTPKEDFPKFAPLSANEIQTMRAAARQADYRNVWCNDEEQGDCDDDGQGGIVSWSTGTGPGARIYINQLRQVAEDEWENDECEVADFDDVDDASFVVACQPSRVLALIATIEARAAELAAEREKSAALLSACQGLLQTGLNGGNNVRLAFISAGRSVLSESDLAGAEKSEAAYQFARAVLAKYEGGE